MVTCESKQEIGQGALRTWIGSEVDDPAGYLFVGLDEARLVTTNHALI